MIEDALFVDGANGARRVRLDDYLEPAAEERALAAEYGWIKQLRHLTVDGQPLRRRFTLRGDSLWWFAELYLHKQQVMRNVFRTVAALETLRAQEQPRMIRVDDGGPILDALAPQFARTAGIRYEGRRRRVGDSFQRIRIDARAIALTSSARLSRLRTRVPPSGSRPVTVAAFVHRAFWRSSETEGTAESYIGPVLGELEARIGDQIAYVGVGPSENFRARRWWHAVVGRGDAEATVVPIESFTPLAKLSDSHRVWRDRHRAQDALLNSAALRQHANIDGYDCWPIVRDEMTGIAFLQWPWSARAMDEAGAAIDALRPEVVVTYAEAGGWGRALMLEARRRGVPTVGLQHGFIYQSWLNYRHEDDEMRPEPGNAQDAGFPAPQRTLVFDEYARSHLERCGRLPPPSVVVTGSPRLDALVRSVSGLTEDEIAAARHMSGAAASQDLVLFVAKYTQSKHVLDALAAAVARMPNVQLVVKAHPAETPEAYSAIVGDQKNIKVLPAAAPLAPLIRASRAVVTVNSTVALDAGVLGVPALVIGLPNNLSPFVSAGIMAGAAARADIEPALRRILYDQEFRLQIERSRGDYFRRFAIGSDGRAAVRSADAVLALAHGEAAFHTRAVSERNDC